MDVPEFMEWLAFKSLENPDTLKKLKHDVMIEDSKAASMDTISNNLRNIFSSLGAK